MSLAKSQLLLFGAGACGRHTARYLRTKGIEPLAFVDNNPRRWQTTYEGLQVMSLKESMLNWPNALYVVTIYRTEAKQVRHQLYDMGVKVAPLSTCIPVHDKIPKLVIISELESIIQEKETLDELTDQINFRMDNDYDSQRAPSDIKDIYFPSFITPHAAEKYIDCGAADGDTICEFRKRQKLVRIIAFEPDAKNYRKLADSAASMAEINCEFYNCALGSASKDIPFKENGDTSSHVDETVTTTVPCRRLDDFYFNPTYIKMDIEGSEIDALRGATQTIASYMPVLAICAYHHASDLWEIPLFIYSIEPEYDLRLRRYAEGASELVWYAVPKDRLR